MHLTAESTNMDLSSLVAQGSNKLPDGKMKSRRPASKAVPDSGWTERGAEVGTVTATLCSAHLFDVTDGKYN